MKTGKLHDAYSLPRRFRLMLDWSSCDPPLCNRDDQVNQLSPNRLSRFPTTQLIADLAVVGSASRRNRSENSVLAPPGISVRLAVALWADAGRPERYVWARGKTRWRREEAKAGQDGGAGMHPKSTFATSEATALLPGLAQGPDRPRA